jgi:hypothetical protein
LIRRLALLGLLLAGRVGGAQSPVIQIEDAGPGIGPTILVEALKRPYTVAPTGIGQFEVSLGSEQPRSLVVLGRNVVIEGHVAGDVIVISGDLFMHPGGSIDGRALAFGGGVYESSLASIAGGVRVFQDFTYDITAVPGGYSLRYRSLMVQPEAGWSLPGIYGIASPEYDRSDGLSLGFAPRYAAPGTPFVVAPKITYRSQLGEVDPSLAVELHFDRRTLLTARVERATRSNDRWIRTDLLNSADFFWSGNDTRNYYRAVGADARFARTVETVHGELTPYVGARVERARSVRPGLDATGGPWTVLARSDEERDDRFRFNPEIDEGTIYSGLFGANWHWTDNTFRLRLNVDGEVGTLDPAVAANGSPTFAQATIATHVDFPTFSQQLFALDGHIVATTGGAAPRQRFAYFGGPGTLPMLDLLSEGGDELLFIDSRYVVPLHWFNLPLLGPPSITVRELLGGAAIRAFPSIHQAVGIRLGVKVFYAEVLIDPDTRRTRTVFGASLSP